VRNFEIEKFGNYEEKNEIAKTQNLNGFSERSEPTGFWRLQRKLLCDY